MTTTQEKLSNGIASKELGNQEFLKGNYKSALYHYHHCLLHVQGLDTDALQAFSPPVSSQNKKSIKETLLATYKNMAACYLKMENWEKAIYASDKAIALSEKDPKAFFRRGQAKAAKGLWSEAESDLKKAVKLAPNDVGIRSELAKLTDSRK